MRRISTILILVALVSVAGLVHAGGAAAGDFAEGPCGGEPSKLCPTATVGQSYSTQFTLKEPGDCGPSFAVSSGSFPPGLSLASDEGVARGTPTQGGSYSFFITVSYSCGLKSPSDQSYTINVNSAVVRAFVSTSSLPDANIGQTYNAPALTAANATSISSWTVAGGALPGGLTLNPNGVISGTPTASGSFSFTVQANAAPNSDTKTLSIFVLAPLELQDLRGTKAPTTGLTASSLVNAPLTTGLKAAGGRAPYVFSSTGTLPPGITLDTATGAITGTGTSAGTFRSSITVTDQTGAKLTVPFAITVRPLLAFVKGKVLAQGRVDRFYTARIPVSGNDARTAFFALAGRIPPGLEYNEVTRRLEGTFLKAGTYRLRVYAFSATGAPISKLFTIRVRA